MAPTPVHTPERTTALGDSLVAIRLILWLTMVGSTARPRSATRYSPRYLTQQDDKLPMAAFLIFRLVPVSLSHFACVG